MKPLLLLLLSVVLAGCGGHGECREHTDQWGTKHECPDGTGTVPPGGH